MGASSRPAILFPPRIVDQLVALDAKGTHSTSYSDVFNFARNKELLFLARRWLELVEAGKLAPEEETPLYNEFIGQFFVQILGYTQASTTEAAFHTLRVTKGVRGRTGIPDVSLGFFDNSAKLEDVRAIAEIKAWSKGLSNPVHTDDHILQTFRYLVNLDCDWGIATNMQEWRLYHRGSAARYQRWTMAELAGFDPGPRESFHALLCRKHLIGKLPGEPCVLTEYFGRVGAEQEAITREFYREYREIRAACLDMLRLQNPQQPVEILIEQTQKLLDRLLFICFAEDQDLLPPDILKHRLTTNLRMIEQPRLANLRELFRAVDQGHSFDETRRIPLYNGGLFAFDPLLDRDLNLTEEIADWGVRLAKWDYYRQVGVDLLGHIFEQSIADLEMLRSEARGETPRRADSRRKREGVFYTPGFVTSYIVEQTVGVLVHQLREQSRQQLELPSDLLEADSEPPDPERLRQHLLNWRDAIVRLRILDPACGSGAFLLAAYKYLKEVLDSIQLGLQRLVPAGELALFSIEDQLLSRCLFGVDLNTESVEITRLSLWIETARKDERLHLLDRNLYTGNSLVADHQTDPRAFDWERAFSELFADGGFDCVIGNPPYVRQERISPYKAYLEQHYACYDSTADLYTYFYELGLKLLRPGGRLGFISGGSFYKGGFGGPLRRHLRETAVVEQILNFGDYRVFPDAEMVDPSIIILQKPVTPQDQAIETRVWLNQNKRELPEEPLEVVLTERGHSVPREALADQQWHLAPPSHQALSAKLCDRGTPLKEVVGGEIYRGVLTGLNRTERTRGEGVFVIDRAKRDALIAEDPRSAEVLKPLLGGKDIKHWHVTPQDRWLVFTRRGIQIDHYPAIKAHLTQYRDRLEPKPEGWRPQFTGDSWEGRKAGDYAWYEIQDTVAYYEAFERPKIIWPDIAKIPRFCADKSGFYLLNTGYVLPDLNWALLGTLNSNAIWHALGSIAQPLGMRAGLFRYRVIDQFVRQLPIPEHSPVDERCIAECAEALSDLGARRYAVIQEVQHRFYSDLLSSSPAAGRSKKIDAWYTASFAELRAEVRRRTKQDIPIKERQEWEGFVRSEAEMVTAFGHEMARLEATMNDAVNRSFGLKTAECDMVNSILQPVGPDAADDDSEE